MPNMSSFKCKNAPNSELMPKVGSPIKARLASPEEILSGQVYDTYGSRSVAVAVISEDGMVLRGQEAHEEYLRCCKPVLELNPDVRAVGLIHEISYAERRQKSARFLASIEGLRERDNLYEKSLHGLVKIVCTRCFDISPNGRVPVAYAFQDGPNNPVCVQVMGVYVEEEWVSEIQLEVGWPLDFYEMWDPVAAYLRDVYGGKLGYLYNAWEEDWFGRKAIPWGYYAVPRDRSGRPRR